MVQNVTVHKLYTKCAFKDAFIDKNEVSMNTLPDKKIQYYSITLHIIICAASQIN